MASAVPTSLRAASRIGISGMSPVFRSKRTPALRVIRSVIAHESSAYTPNARTWPPEMLGSRTSM